LSDYILKIDVLDLSYNDLTDTGLNSFVQKLANYGSTIQELNLSGNRITDDTLFNIANHIKRGNLKNLITVKSDGNKQVTQ
jgi:Ran GTPase-activating protein (RanGAP) involved in mRNA processing and transport